MPTCNNYPLLVELCATSNSMALLQLARIATDDKLPEMTSFLFVYRYVIKFKLFRVTDHSNIYV